MQRLLSSRGFTLVFASVAILALACADTAPTASDNSPLDGLTQVAINDTGVAIPLDSLPPDSVPPDSIPPDSVPPDSIPPDSVPPDSIPPDSLTPPDSTPPSPPPPSPGYFRGSVVGQFQAAAGSDSMAGAPRLANVRVTVYPRLSATDPTAIGPQVASVLTDANGYFQLPTLSGGEYVLAFNPPEGSKYRGVWSTATANNHSHEYSWWIVLAVK